MITITKQSREYADIDFSFARHPITDNVAIKKNINAVKQSVLHLLTLKEGDKPFHPEIKSPIYGFLFENATIAVKIVLESEIRKYLNSYEPRIFISEVNVSFPDSNTIACSITGELVNLSEPITINILIDRIL